MALRPVELTVARACALLQLSRSHYYAAGSAPAAAASETAAVATAVAETAASETAASETAVPEPQTGRTEMGRPPVRLSEAVLCERLEALCLAFPRYGYRRLTAQLRREGLWVNHKRVLRLQRELQLTCRVRRRRGCTTQSQHGYGRYPKVLVPHALTGLNQGWVADLTYVRLREQFAYLAVILDAYSRRVIGWALGTRPTTALCLEALRQALASRRPAPGFVHHSDQGVQYASTEYVSLLTAHGAVISMSRTGNPYDNARMESFFKTLKHEEVYLQEHETLADAQRRLPQFLEAVYNQQRLHSALGYVPPAEFEAQLTTPE